MDQHYEDRPDKLLSRIGLGLFLMTLAILGSQIAIDSLIISFFPEVSKSGWYAFSVTGIIMLGIGIPVLSAVIKGVPSSKRGEEVRLTVKQFLGYFLVCTAFMYIANILGTMINMQIASLLGKETLVNPLEEVIERSNLFILFLYGSIIGPILEEIIFRKLLLDKLRSFGDLPAILLTGFAFGLFHMNLQQFFYATVLGFVFAYVTIRTNTVRYAIILHIMVNFIGFMVAPFTNNESILAVFGLWVILAIITGMILFFRKAKELVFEKGEIEVENKILYVINVGTVLFIALCVFWIGLMLLVP
ncbi:CPBP family intramembrane metalloprotease [Mobilitalea sibirica]|uniref:CPBP family intramembrane metalloprotease n=1 Tax=Mobilitalea sibirica TaxID=1462919 RepID=A0A8J7KZL4_9FIRM|nr:type II CAAX endopeptidase family protein [Mobilitalea sibirica]MBH1940443.1 CPBP family intramembrane metalloprotease [Mobilitalea sibirica]